MGSLLTLGSNPSPSFGWTDKESKGILFSFQMLKYFVMLLVKFLHHLLTTRLFLLVTAFLVRSCRLSISSSQRKFTALLNFWAARRFNATSWKFRRSWVKLSKSPVGRNGHTRRPRGKNSQTLSTHSTSSGVSLITGLFSREWREIFG